jgi:hypothetical protein
MLDFLDKTNLTIVGLIAVLGGMLKLLILIKEFKHELNSRLDELNRKTYDLGMLHGADREREKSRLIAKELIRDTADQARQQQPPIVHTDDLGS